MRFDAAKSAEQPGKRSSLPADAVALLCAAALLAIAVWSGWSSFIPGVSGRRLYLVLALTLGFAVAARVVHGVSTSGAVAGAAVAFIMAGRDLRIFCMLLIVFLITFLATRVGALRKHQLRLAEAEDGRSASQVMANLGIGALALAIPNLGAAYLLALAALAEVAADTTSSEIGTAFSSRTIMITSWKTVSPGTDGGISLSGTVAGILAALITAACAFALGLASVSAAVLVACAGVAGMLVDSLLGASIERRGYLNNDLVNLLSTAAAACIAIETASSFWLLAFGVNSSL